MTIDYNSSKGKKQAKEALQKHVESHREAITQAGFDFDMIVNTPNMGHFINVPISTEERLEEAKRSVDHVFYYFEGEQAKNAHLQINLIKEALEILPKNTLVNENADSYGLKHVFEELMHEYTPNIFVQVAGAQVKGLVTNDGYYKRMGGRSINESYNISQKALNTLRAMRHGDYRGPQVKGLSEKISKIFADCNGGAEE